MAEWLYEEGIGEARAGLIEHGRLVEALVERETEAARAGAVVQGRLLCFSRSPSAPTLLLAGACLLRGRGR